MELLESHTYQADQDKLGWHHHLNVLTEASWSSHHLTPDQSRSQSTGQLLTCGSPGGAQAVEVKKNLK